MRLFKGKNGEVVELIAPENDEIEVVLNGEPARELKAGTTDAALEKHVPSLSREGDVLTVQVGEIEHPMLDTHYITNIWVELPDGTVIKKALKPGERPVAEFDLTGVSGPVKVYEYCNLHGLWSADIDV